MTVEDAVMQMNLLGDEHLVFTDAGTGSTSVLYRRRGRQLRPHRDEPAESPTGGKAPR